MKVVILAGGFGTRLEEETYLKPKRMIEIGGRPILWHIMKICDHYEFNEFIICLGYKEYYDKRIFSCRFGAIVLNKKDTVIGFQEKPKSEEA